MNPIEKIVSIAKAEEGYVEKATNSQLDDKTANIGNGNWNKYAQYMDRTSMYAGKKNGYAWCDIFVDWCFVQAFGIEGALELTCQPLNGYGAGCTFSARYYKAHNKFHKSNPQAGDQIFFSDGTKDGMCHTGLVTAVDSNRVYTVEGNTSSSPGTVMANGGCVRCKSYRLDYDRIGGYGRPDYTQVEQKEENTMGLNKQEVEKLISEAISKEHKVYGTLNEVPESYRPSVGKLVHAGYLNGYDAKSPDTVEDNILNVDETFCRVITVLDNAGVLNIKEVQP